MGLGLALALIASGPAAALGSSSRCGALVLQEDLGGPFEFEDELEYARPFLAAWNGSNGARTCGLALTLSVELRDDGRVGAAIDLLERVIERYPDDASYPMLLAMLADLLRSRGRYEETFELLDQVEVACDGAEGVYPTFARCYGAGYRVQAFLDLGLVRQAQAGLEIEEQRMRDLVSKMRDNGWGTESDIAKMELASAYRAYNTDVALGLHEFAQRTISELMTADLLQHAPEERPRLQMLQGQALLKRARDARAGMDRGDPSLMLEEARSSLQAALSSDSTSEVRYKALVTLADACWLSADTEGEREALRSAYEQELEVESRWLGDRAAFRARRLLEDEAPPDDLQEALTELEQTYALIEQEWLAVSRPYEGLGFLQWDEQRLVLSSWCRLLIELHGPARGAELSLEALMRAQGITTLSRRIGEQVTDLPTEPWRGYRASLPPGAGVLVFLPSMDSSLVLAFDRDEATCAEVPESSQVLERMMRLFADFCETPPGEQQDQERTARQAEDLSQALFPSPIRERLLAWDRVSIIGAELLGAACLEPLPLDGAPLGSRLATSYVPSLDLAAILERRGRGSAFDPGRVKVIVAAEGAVAPPIETTDEEVRALERVAGGAIEVGSSQLLHGSHGSGVLAVLAHGKYLPRELRPAHLAFQDGYAGGSDLEAADMPPVVCLLACEAARGPVVPGDDGAVHLGGAALVGGAQAVLLSRNDIEMAATLALFFRFQKELREGVEPDEALRRARVALPRIRPSWGHPFYTQSLRLFGLGRLPRN